MQDRLISMKDEAKSAESAKTKSIAGHWRTKTMTNSGHFCQPLHLIATVLFFCLCCGISEGFLKRKMQYMSPLHEVIVPTVEPR